MTPEGGNTPIGSGGSSPERRGSDEEKGRNGISRESTMDGGSYARCGDAFGGVAKERVSLCRGAGGGGGGGKVFLGCFGFLGFGGCRFVSLPTYEISSRLKTPDGSYRVVSNRW